MTSQPDGPASGMRGKLRSLTAGGRRMASSDSVTGAARLAGGTAAGQIILVGVSPILTRLYSPSDFGSLAIFVSLVGLVIVISAGGYHYAIMLPDKDDDATVVTGLSLVIVGLTSVVTAIVAVAFWAFGVFADSLGAWILLWPLAVLFGGAAQVLSAYAIRYGKYGVVAGANLIKALVTAVVQIVLGLLGFVAGGLISGHFLGMSSANVKLARPALADLRRLRPSLQDMRAAAREYDQFPKHTLPSNLVNVGFLSATPLVVGWLFGTVTLGFWSLANSFVYMPSVLVSQAVGQVYYRKAVALRNSVAESVRLFDRTVVLLACGSFVPFAAMAVAAPYLFAFVFGEEWRVAGEYAQVMMPAVWLRFVTAPVATTAMAHGANRVLVWISGLQIVAIVIAVGVTLWFNLDPIAFLIVFTALVALVQVAALVLVRRTIGGNPQEPQAMPTGDAGL